MAETECGTQHDWPKVFSNYQASIDNPATCVWRELIDTYPDAKVLLTTHPSGPDAWYDSVMDTIYFTEIKWQWKVLEAVVPFAKKFGPMARKLIWQRFHKGSMNQRITAVEEYNRHIEEVKSPVPAEKLFVFKVSEGWEPLCNFLGLEIPDQPYPRVNDKGNMKKEIKGMVKGAYTILAIGALGLFGLTALIWNIL